MRLYTVHQPPGGGPDDLVLVREGFSFWAFLFVFLWAAAHRLWWEAAGILAIWIVLVLASGPLGASGTVLLLGFHVLVGFEARDLQRWSMERQGWRELGTVSGNSEEAAQRRFLDLTAVS